MDTGPIEVHEIDVAATHDLRARVLRNHLPGLPVGSDSDNHAATTHLGAYRDGRLAGVVTLFPDQAPGRPAGARARRFRFMAVEPEQQGEGIGRVLIDAVLQRARAEGDQTVWANGRDGVLGFYSRLGFSVVGEGFVDPVSQLPHHLVVLDL